MEKNKTKPTDGTKILFTQLSFGKQRTVEGNRRPYGARFCQCGTDKDLCYESTKTWQTLDIWRTWSKWWCNLISNYFWHNAPFWGFLSIWPLPWSVFLCVSACWPVCTPLCGPYVGLHLPLCLSMCIVCANVCLGVWWTLPACWSTSVVYIYYEPKILFNSWLAKSVMSLFLT